MTHSQLRNLGTIRMVQERIATGHDDSGRSTAYVIRGDELWQGQPVITISLNEADDYAANGMPIVGEYSIVRPAILAGTWEEFEGDVARTVESRLVRDGYAYLTGDEELVVLSI